MCHLTNYVLITIETTKLKTPNITVLMYRRPIKTYTKHMSSNWKKPGEPDSTALNHTMWGWTPHPLCHSYDGRYTCLITH